MVSEIEQFLFYFIFYLNTIKKNVLDGELFSLKSVRPIIEKVNRFENKIDVRRIRKKLFASRTNGRTLVWANETNFNLYSLAEEKAVPRSMPRLLL